MGVLFSIPRKGSMHTSFPRKNNQILKYQAIIDFRLQYKVYLVLTNKADIIG